MQATEYHLYRVKFIKPVQMDFFSADRSPREFFEMALAEKPSLELRKNNVWRIANIEQITPDGGRFAVGRTTITTVEKFDIASGNFTDLVDDSGPYTFVYFDSRLGLIGIGKRTKVAANVKTIAGTIQKLLSKTETASHNRLTVHVDYIPDPESFLEKIYSAHAIKNFKAHFTGPNPIDADELFQKPMSYYCKELDGTNGNVSVNGNALSADAVAAVAKSTAATANRASAAIQLEHEGRVIPISLKGDAKFILVDQDCEKLQTLKAIQSAYREIRE
ncbi:MAG TPA: hypothetical protein VJ001_00925 [Rhodocyclaceae bacterium]|nr:hypothetical protein [Rhodocyclaceae bacterium]